MHFSDHPKPALAAQKHEKVDAGQSHPVPLYTERLFWIQNIYTAAHRRWSLQWRTRAKFEFPTRRNQLDIGRLVELLKASGWQSGMIAFACCAYLFLEQREFIPTPPSEWVVTCVWMLLLLTTGLAIAPFCAWLQRHFEAIAKKRELANKRLAAQSKFVSDIQFMSHRERIIFGYLLKRGTNTFYAEQSGGHAANLIGKGYVQLNAVPGQSFEMWNMPLKVPDHIWEMVLAHRDEFPYEPVYLDKYDREEIEPWRRPNW